MNKLTQLKLLALMFVTGTLLLAVGSMLFMATPWHRWLLLGLYTWSGSIFIIFKTRQFLSSKRLDFGLDEGEGVEGVEGVYTEYMTDDERTSNNAKNPTAKRMQHGTIEK